MKKMTCENLPPLGVDVLVCSGNNSVVRHLQPRRYLLCNDIGISLGWYPGGLDIGDTTWSWLPNTDRKDKKTWQPHRCEVPTIISGYELRDWAIECLRCKQRDMNYISIPIVDGGWESFRHRFVNEKWGE